VNGWNDSCDFDEYPHFARGKVNKKLRRALRGAAVTNPLVTKG
jgi:hypothetical protein